MKGQRRTEVPRARDKRLIVRELSEETIVYDIDRSRAHCLGPVAAAVWRHCDGRSTAARVAALVEAETGVGVDQATVWLAVGRLSDAHLLEVKVAAPGGRSRREWLKGAAVVAGASVLTITAPLAVEAATCVADCTSRPQSPPGNCGAIPCCPPATGNCCRQGGGSNCNCRATGDCSA